MSFRNDLTNQHFICRRSSLVTMSVFGDRLSLTYAQSVIDI